MIDLHSHILPGVDDGAADLSTAVAMARAYVADGVTTVACTPHILPGLYNNSGPAIRDAVRSLQSTLDSEGLPLQLLSGADNHIVPDFAAGLRSGRLLALGDSHYVLVEPPHHVAPQRLPEFFFELLVAGYTPILTHPERLSWIETQYETIRSLIRSGVWMQVTAGSLAGAFGRSARYWAERMLDEGGVHILATDAHDVQRRPPDLSRGRELAARRVGDEEASLLVSRRPHWIVKDEPAANVPLPAGSAPRSGMQARLLDAETSGRSEEGAASLRRLGAQRWISRRLRQFLE
ncbi:tyrosine-protein phosphatase [Aquabacter spiritensis]|uniref:tyrosine-protein phosphatase n=1 Tax=Aquabacter spiritensis TaxID=933073 RepID=UPI001A9E0C3E|nr:CpsB/CapC family capsule biosynthesis tyrosine phosphatase [Aquabacter spiritensis]